MEPTDKDLLVSLISENRNALVPALHWIEKLDTTEAAKVRNAIQRVLDYTTEIARKAGGF